MPTSTELSDAADLLTEALKRKMPSDIRLDLAKLRLTAELRRTLRQKVPALEAEC